MGPITFNTLEGAIAAGYERVEPQFTVIEKHGAAVVQIVEVGMHNPFTEFEIRMFADKAKYRDLYDVVATSKQIWLRNEKNNTSDEGCFIVRFKTEDMERARHLLD